MQVRWITAEDTIPVMDLCRAFHAASPRGRQIPFSDDAMRKWLDRAALQNGDMFGVVAIAGDGALAGAFLAFCIPFFFSEAKYAGDLFINVLEPYRGSRAFLMMEQAYTVWAKERGCVEVVVGVSAGISDEHAGRSLEHLGYAAFGAAYRKEIAHVL